MKKVLITSLIVLSGSFALVACQATAGIDVDPYYVY